MTASIDPTIADDFVIDVLTKTLGKNAIHTYNTNTDVILSPKKKWTIAVKINAKIIEMKIPPIVAPIVSDTSIILPPLNNLWLYISLSVSYTITSRVFYAEFVSSTFNLFFMLLNEMNSLLY